MAQMTLIDAVRTAMDEEMARDERVFLTGEDVGRRGGVFRASQGLFDKYGDMRVVDSPLAELSIVAVGIGAALADLRPICEIQFADFIHPAFNQIVNEAAKMYYRSNGQWKVPMVLRVPYGGGIAGGLYHSQSVEAFFTHCPGLKIVIPSTPEDAKGLLKSAVRDPNPVLFFEPKKGYGILDCDWYVNVTGAELPSSIPTISAPRGRTESLLAGPQQVQSWGGNRWGSTWLAAFHLGLQDLDNDDARNTAANQQRGAEAVWNAVKGMRPGSVGDSSWS